eukprot:TRINITY_DN1020_c0_g4_i2.p1 TRINITY_DN1020_c0_g4~~TRINITY_DN1020_c0_g4_i2.p1  ORF type:complete len:416 (-),score=71.02 TRINITY_DN1020_c0_g4_i2:76-1323(-)
MTASLSSRSEVTDLETATLFPTGTFPLVFSFAPVQPKSSSSFNYISPQTASDLVNGRYQHLGFESIVIIDCRYDYEYEGGHIKGAINCPNPESIDALFQTMSPDSHTCFVFHCEFSSERAPRGFKRIREADRQLNLHRYPLLSFPEMYILEGGYKAFFHQHQQECDPPFYVPMRLEEHRTKLHHSQGAYKKPTISGKAKKFSRSCSNIFEGISESDMLWMGTPQKKESADLSLRLPTPGQRRDESPSFQRGWKTERNDRTDRTERTLRTEQAQPLFRSSCSASNLFEGISANDSLWNTPQKKEENLFGQKKEGTESPKPVSRSLWDLSPQEGSLFGGVENEAVWSRESRSCGKTEPIPRNRDRVVREKTEPSIRRKELFEGDDSSRSTLRSSRPALRTALRPLSLSAANSKRDTR